MRTFVGRLGTRRVAKTRSSMPLIKIIFTHVGFIGDPGCRTLFWNPIETARSENLSDTLDSPEVAVMGRVSKSASAATMMPAVDDWLSLVLLGSRLPSSSCAPLNGVGAQNCRVGSPTVDRRTACTDVVGMVAWHSSSFVAGLVAQALLWSSVRKDVLDSYVHRLPHHHQAIIVYTSLPNTR